MKFHRVFLSLVNYDHSRIVWNLEREKVDRRLEKNEEPNIDMFLILIDNWVCDLVDPLGDLRKL